MKNKYFEKLRQAHWADRPKKKSRKLWNRRNRRKLERLTKEEQKEEGQ